jgi:hypothetical protein
VSRTGSPNSSTGPASSPPAAPAKFKETALLPDFFTDIFCGLLGYTGPAASSDTYTFSRERHVEVDGKVADAVLGRFQKDKTQFMAVLEGKGAHA